MVIDNGTPSLSATQSFIVFIGSVAAPALSQPTWSANAFSMTVAGDVGLDCTIQSSTNLTTWTDLFATNPVTMPFTWTDTVNTNYSSRFYRVLLGP